MAEGSPTRTSPRFAGGCSRRHRRWSRHRRRSRQRAGHEQLVENSVADGEEADVPAAVELPVRLGVVAREDHLLRVLAVDHAAVLVRVYDGPRIRSGPDIVEGVVGVDEVLSVTRPDHGCLALLAAGVVVAPDLLPPVAARDPVVAIAA